jgi:acetyl esterase
MVRVLELDEKIRRILEKMDKDGIPSSSSLSVVEARRLSREMAKELAGSTINVTSIRDFKVTTNETEIPVRVYVHSTRPLLPALVYFHGGGWVIGDLDSVDWICRNLAVATECAVFSVDYRLAPEHKFPTPAEDCYRVTKWIVENGPAESIDSNRVAVGGDSAGGNLATVVCLMARDRGGPSLVYQLLIYPITNHAFTTQSYREYANGYYLTAEDMKWFWNHYLREQTDGSNPYASPFAAKNLSGLPPALIITAGFDPLRDEGEAYATRLRDAGVSAKISRYDSMIHGFLDFPDLKQTRAAIDEAANELRNVFRKK